MCEVQVGQKKHLTSLPENIQNCQHSPKNVPPPIFRGLGREKGKLTACTLVGIHARAPLGHLQVVLRHDVVARVRAASQLLARIAMAQHVLQLLSLTLDGDLPLAAAAVTAALPPLPLFSGESDAGRPLGAGAEEHAVTDVDDDAVLDERVCGAAEGEVDGVLGEVVVEIVLRRELEHEGVRHALVERLPRPVLAHAHRQHVRPPRQRVQALVLQRPERLEVRLEVGPRDGRLVLEQHNVRDGLRGVGWDGHFGRGRLGRRFGRRRRGRRGLRGWNSRRFSGTILRRRGWW